MFSPNLFTRPAIDIWSADNQIGPGRATLHTHWRQIAKWARQLRSTPKAQRHKLLPHQGERERARRLRQMRRHHGHITPSITSASAAPRPNPNGQVEG